MEVHILKRPGLAASIDAGEAVAGFREDVEPLGGPDGVAQK